jgi:hypothetical protein
MAISDLSEFSASANQWADEGGDCDGGGRGLISLLGELFGKKVADREDGDVRVCAHVQEVVVTRHNVGSIGNDGAAKENVIVRVSSHDRVPFWHFKDRS